MSDKDNNGKYYFNKYNILDGKTVKEEIDNQFIAIY
jgi:hypothetical protein